MYIYFFKTIYSSIIAFLASVIASSSAITLTCTYIQGSRYTCRITALTLTSQDVNDRTITDVAGTHLSGNSNADVTSISSLTTSNTINYLFRGIDSFFPNLQVVFINSANLLQIEAADLAQFPLATSINLFSNQLTTIPSDLFSGTPLVEIIDLGSNKIACIGSNAFNGLSLKTLFLDTNVCTSFGGSGASITSGLPGVYSSCDCSPPTTAEPTTTPEPVTPNPCIEASENQTIEFNNTIDSLKGFFTDSINSAFSGVCTINNIDLVNTRIQNLDDDLTAFVTQTNSNFQNALDVLNSLTSAIDNLDSELRTFRDATYAKLNVLEECSCKKNNGNCGSNGNEKCNGNGRSA